MSNIKPDVYRFSKLWPKELDQIEQVFNFPVAHVGWEVDNEGWIVVFKDKTKKLVLTNHGSLYIADPHELIELVSKYESLIRNTKKAIDYL